MAYYRLYHVVNGHFTRHDEFPADDDVQAVRLADRWVAGEPAELWCEARLIKKYHGGKTDRSRPVRRP